MKNLLIFMLLLPALVYSQQKKQKSICTPSKTQIICCSDTSKVVVNVATPQQGLIEKDLKEAIINKLKEKNMPEGALSILKWLLPALLVLAGTMIGVAASNRRVYSENHLKANIEWIKDIRGMVSELASSWQNSNYLFQNFLDTLADYKDASEKHEMAVVSGNANLISQAKSSLDLAQKSVMDNVSLLGAEVRKTTLPLMGLQVSLDSSSVEQKELQALLETLFENIRTNKFLTIDSEIKNIIEKTQEVAGAKWKEILDEKNKSIFQGLKFWS